MKKTGLFICHCGINIASTVDIAKVKDALKHYPGIAYIQDYKYMCSDPGQALVKKRLQKKDWKGLLLRPVLRPSMKIPFVLLSIVWA